MVKVEQSAVNVSSDGYANVTYRLSRMSIKREKLINSNNGTKKPEDPMADIDMSCHILGRPCFPGEKRIPHIAIAARPTKDASA